MSKNEPKNDGRVPLIGKLLQIRKSLRSGGPALSKHFDIHRGFDAFSVHLLAGGIEPLLNAVGVITETNVVKWSRSGNVTIVECRVDLVDTESGEMRSYTTIGEGTDGSDKGVGKAISNARKQAHIMIYNLAIGVDVEDDDQKSTGVNNMQAVTQQYPMPVTFDVVKLTGEVVSITAIDVMKTFIEALNDAKSNDDVQTFLARNDSLAQRLSDSGRRDILGTLNNAIEVHAMKFSAPEHAAA